MKEAVIRFYNPDGSYIDMVYSEDYANFIFNSSKNEAIGDGCYFPDPWWKKILKKLRWLR